MALDLYMIGLAPRDMEESLEFYRRLGVAIPEGGEGQQHVPVKMGRDLTFFLNTTELVDEADRPRIILEFYLEERAAVDAKYEELTGLGYRSYRDPFVTPFGMYFAMVNDPDGNVVLLSADA
jgi:predicted lactoylglutathione lyase